MNADQLRKLEKTFRSMASEGLALPMVEAMGDAWVAQSKTSAPVDTGQLKARIAIQSSSGTAARASAVIVSDVPYAGFVEFGTARMPARPYFRSGRDAAEQVAERAGGMIRTEISKKLTTGGTWNPRQFPWSGLSRRTGPVA